ncbi:MAG: DUF2087 domain-containing protein [Candidatus Limnocylindria bacterium]
MRKAGNERRRETAPDPELWRYFKDGRIERMPASRDARLRLLRFLALQFEPDRSYDEGAVNRLLSRFDEDFASLRRHLVDEGLLVRAAGIYRRAPAAGA